MKFFITAIAMVMVMGVSTGFAGDPLMTRVSLSEEQLEKLSGLIVESTKKQHKLLAEIESKQFELVQEIRKEDRFDSKLKEITTNMRINSLTKEISKLYGDLLKTKVTYLLKAKNTLTMEQKMLLIAELEFFDDEYEEDLPVFPDMDLLTIPLDLTNAQIKKMLSHETDTIIKELKIELEVEFHLLDLQDVLENENVDSKKVDSIIMKIADLGAQVMDNRINGFLKSKDVLTNKQKKKMLHIFMMD